MITVKDLYKKFGKKNVLQGINLTIEAGQTVVILGQSGSGKSVLLRHIMGLEAADSGSIEINGHDVAKMDEKERYSALKKMGMLFQNSALFDSMTIRENTAFYLLEHTEMSPEEINKEVDKALEMVGLGGTQDQMPSDLSGGMRKRAALARLIVYRPEILLYDEPTTGLDPIRAMQINDLILMIQKELKATSIVVTHDLCSALHVGDFIAFNHEGKILHFVPKKDLLKLKDPIVKSFLKNAIPEINLS